MALRWFTGILMMVSLTAAAGELSVEEVWRAIAKNSPLQSAARLQYESAQIGAGRADRHWYPRLYLDGRAYRTNEPGAAFFGVLSQRSVTSTDFAPDSLNHPEDSTYKRAALGVDLPLYEGGSGVGRAELQKHIANNQRFEMLGIQVQEYGDTVQAYGSLSARQSHGVRLEEMRAFLRRLIEKYQLGSKGNPVGYSGLLGFKTLYNRIEGLILENKSMSEGLYAQLRAMGVTEVSWKPRTIEAAEFSDRYLPLGDYIVSPMQNARVEGARALASRAEMEKARFRPQIGAFAEKYMFSGERETADGYTAGLYLRWNILNLADAGAAKEATLQASAIESKSRFAGHMERAESESLAEAAKTLRENLKLLRSSATLMEEQTKTAEVLFRNGSINALQLGEVLSRRVDLLSSTLEAELSLLKVSAELAVKREFKLPAGMESL